MSTRRVVLVALAVVGASLAVAAVYAHGSWRDLWLNLLAEAAGAAFIVLVVDVLFERSKARERDVRRRLALSELGSILRELHAWIVDLSSTSDAGIVRHERAGDADALEASLNGLVGNLGAIDFAAPGVFKRDRYFVEWARRRFDQTTVELGRWEWSFVDSAGLFEDDFRQGAESLRNFVRAMGSFLAGMEHYIVREKPTSPVFAYEGVGGGGGPSSCWRAAGTPSFEGGSRSSSSGPRNRAFPKRRPRSRSSAGAGDRGRVPPTRRAFFAR